MTQLQSRVIKTDNIHWKNLQFLQDDNFKEWVDDGDRKLLHSILKYQFIDPFKVWDQDGVIFCLDGKHRYLDLLKVEESGIEVPDFLPATFIECRTMQEAAELVLIYSSAYARITQQGLNDYIAKFNLQFPNLKDSIQLPDFSMQRFEQKFDLFNVNNAEEPEVTVTNIHVQPGDIFRINNHRIICGSFTSAEDVAALMQGARARIVNCDPPYNLPANFFLKDNKKTHNHKDFAMGAGEMNDEEFVTFLALIMHRSVENSLPGAIHYIFMDFRHMWHMTEAGWRIYGTTQPKQLCVWNKDIMANGSFYRAQHELCFVFSNEQAKALWNNDLLDEGGFYKNENELCFIFKNGDGAKHLSHLELKDRIRTNIWKYPSAVSVANPDRKEIKNHPTPKPVAMIADAILDTTNPGDIVIDWFLGSGTCLIACEHTGRSGRFTEIEPVYVQSSIKRYYNYCMKRGIAVNFSHLNGLLTLNDFTNE